MRCERTMPRNGGSSDEALAGGAVPGVDTAGAAGAGVAISKSGCNAAPLQGVLRLVADNSVATPPWPARVVTWSPCDECNAYPRG